MLFIFINLYYNLHTPLPPYIISAAKVIQKFGRMVVAWSRFWVEADKKAARKKAEEIKRRYTAAANVIGFYWRRWKEIKLLKNLFVLRRKVSIIE